jgi:secernin
VFWWTPGPPCNGCYVPFFVEGSHVSAIVSQAGVIGKQIIPSPEAAADSFASTSYWWLFRQLMDTVKGDAIAARPGDYMQRNPIVRAQFDHLEQAFAAEVPEIWRGYVAACDPRMLDRFTERCVERVVRTLQGMLNEWNAEPKEVSA